MQRVYILAALLGLNGCGGASAYQPQYATPQPSLSQIQGQCFAGLPNFKPQADCIANAVAASGVVPGPYTQEYLAYTQSLQDKVSSGDLSESEARLALATKLNEHAILQRNEDAIQEQLAYQRAAYEAEVLKQFENEIPLLEFHPISRGLELPTRTNCQAYGNQVQCTSQ